MNQRLGVNVDHVATIREARGTDYPDPVNAAHLAELAGADQITVHLREDRRHIQKRDVQILRRTVQTRLNLEMAATQQMLEIAAQIEPDTVTLVPERRDEQTTEGGLAVWEQFDFLGQYISQLAETGATVSLFVDPDVDQIEAAYDLDVEAVELHTGDYCEAGAEYANRHRANEGDRSKELQRLRAGARQAAEYGLMVAAGHGLNFQNIEPVASIEAFEEFNIGHSLVSRASLVGIERAVRRMKELIASS